MRYDTANPDQSTALDILNSSSELNMSWYKFSKSLVRRSMRTEKLAQKVIEKRRGTIIRTTDGWFQEYNKKGILAELFKHESGDQEKFLSA